MSLLAVFHHNRVVTLNEVELTAVCLVNLTIVVSNGKISHCSIIAATSQFESLIFSHINSNLIVGVVLMHKLIL